MTFTLEEERLPVDTGWGVLYSLPLYNVGRESLMRITEQGDLVALITKIGAGDETAMANLYDATVNRIYGMAMKIVIHPELAEEVVSDVYLQVWRKANHFNESRAAPIGWLLMICRSRALDKLRREKSATMNQYQEHEQRDFKDENIVAPLDDIMKGEISNQVSSALLVLNDNQRQFVALAFYRGMSHQQISNYTGQPLGTVKSNIRRAQDVLRNVLDKDHLGAHMGTGGLYGKA